MKKIFTSFLHYRTGSTIFLVFLTAGWLALTGQTSHSVEVSNYQFSPDELTVAVGDTVVWTNTGGSHNVNGTQTAYPDNPESFGNDVGSGWVYSYVFTKTGVNDYHCDPHLSLGMTGKIIVEDPAPDTLVVNFSEMTPHVDQTLWLGVWDSMTGDEVARVSTTVTESFSLVVPGIVSGHSYLVDFFADFNENGYYDAPSTDHAWRLELTDVTGNDTLNFTHNTDFTDIEWNHRLVVNFSAMDPHVGQMLTLYVRDSASGDYLDTVVVEEILDPAFEVKSYAITPENSYTVDFYADLNTNGMYDAPPTDHAWRLQTGTAMGDVVLDFVHNTDFTDIFAATGLESSRSAPEVSLYPNPVTDQLHLSSEAGIESVSVVSMTGAAVRSVTGSGSNSLTIGLDDLKAGIYLMKIETSDHRHRIHRVVKR